MTTAQGTKSAATDGTEKDDVMEHVRAIREDFAALAASTGKLAQGQFKKQGQRAGDIADNVVEKAASYRDLLTEKVKDHPLASIGIAALAGLIFATMHRK